MTNDNQDALRCADALDAGENFYGESSMWYDTKLADAAADSADHLRRLVRENEFLSRALADRNVEVIHAAQQLNAKDTLLRQALTAFRAAHGSQSTIPMLDAAISAIRQHLEGRA